MAQPADIFSKIGPILKGVGYELLLVIGASKVDHASYWIEQAEYDLETAKAMWRTGRFLYVGFMCQQTVEKALKAVVAKHGSFPPKTHDLIRLAELANLRDSLSKEQNQLLDELYPLNIEARYPSHKEKLAQTLNDRACSDYISKTETMLKWIKDKLAS
jgi:HEPN domain-containing protein